MSEEQVLLSYDRDGVRTLTLNRPDRKNAINPQLWEELADALRAAARDTELRALVITGAGGSFCSGADITTPEDIHPRHKLRRLTDVALALHELAVPTIAKVTGVAVGAGWNLALGCDFVVATPESRFCQIFSKRGLSVDLGGSWLLPKLVGLQQAKRLVLLADMIDADEARTLGLVTWVKAADEIDAFVDRSCGRLAAGPPVALAQSKALLNDGANATLREALANEARAQPGNFATADSTEAYAAFAEKRETRRSLVDGLYHPDRSNKMRETVIVEAVRTPVGKRNGGLSDMHAADLSAHRAQRAGGARGRRPRDRRRRGLGLRLAGRRPVEQYRPLLGAGRRLARDHPWHHGQPGLRVEPAGAGLRRAGRDVRPAGRRRGGRCRGDEPGAAGFGAGHRHAVRAESPCPLWRISRSTRASPRR